jgi:serine-type D-Ala-D-Ala carboxypeptidase
VKSLGPIGSSPAAALALLGVAGLAMLIGWRDSRTAAVPPESTAAVAAVEAPEPSAAAAAALAWGHAEVRLRAEAERKAFPGAAMAAGTRDHVDGIAAVGRHEWAEDSRPISADSTLFDLASLTKAVATTTAVMLLVEDGALSLDDPVQRHLPGFQGQFKERVTIRHLLTHTSGLPAGTRLNGRTPAEVLRRLQRTLIPVPPGTQVVYSDIGFVILWAAAESAAGEPLPRLLQRRVWEPLGMTSTRFAPGGACVHCAPTLHLERGPRIPFRGEPADLTARRLGGIAGSAGLFSNAQDLARFAAMIANGGLLDGARILSEASVREMLRQQPNAGNRTLGWVAFCPEEERTAGSPCERPEAFGHLGFTGTSIHVDPVSGRWVVLLSNRTYLPRARNEIGELRTDIWRALAE